MITFQIPQSVFGVWLLPNGGFITSLGTIVYAVFNPTQNPKLYSGNINQTCRDNQTYLTADGFFLDENGEITNRPILKAIHPFKDNHSYSVQAFYEPSQDIPRIALGLQKNGLVVLNRKTNQFKIFNAPAYNASFNINAQVILAHYQKTIYLIDNPFEVD